MKTKKLILTSLILIFVMLISFGCTRKNPGGLILQDSVKLYFGNKDCTDLVEEKFNIEGIDIVELPGLVMEKLLAGPQKQEHSRIIRAGTSLLDIAAEKGEITVNLSKEFYNEENIMDVLASAAIVKSLCSVNGVVSVTIMVEGNDLVLDDGTAVRGMRDGDLVFDADALTQDEANITLYFSDAEASGLMREVRRVKVSKGDALEKVVLSELIKGPEQENLYKTIPTETKIRSVETTDGTCFVNLSNDFITKHVGGTAVEQLTVYSIVNALTELSNVERVQFLIEGEKKDVFIHMVFNEPITRDVSMIQK